MSLIKWTPIIDPFEEMEEMMNRFSLFKDGGKEFSFIPAIDLYETKDSVVVESSLAGADPKKVDISVEDGALIIKGDSKKEHEVEDKNYYRKEVRAGVFFRRVPLPVKVVEDKISAEFKGGILRITCPKQKETKNKKVDIKIKE